MKHLVYLIATITFMGCGTGKNPTTTAASAQYSSSTGADPWIAEERWIAGIAYVSTAWPHADWTPEQRMVYDTVDAMIQEFGFLSDEGTFIGRTQEECERTFRGALFGKALSTGEGPYVLRLGMMTPRFKEEILAEPHPVPEGWDDLGPAVEPEDVKFLDLLFGCEKLYRLYRFVRIAVEGNTATAFVNARGGKLVGKDTLIDGKQYGLPEFDGNDCSSVRFDLIKVDGEWKVDHRIIQESKDH